MILPGRTALGRSLINITKNSGPSKEPWGTPDVTSHQDDETPSIFYSSSSFHTIEEESRKFQNCRPFVKEPNGTLYQRPWKSPERPHQLGVFHPKPWPIDDELVLTVFHNIFP